MDRSTTKLELLFGPEEVIRRAIELITAGSPSEVGDAILLSFQGATDPFDKAPKLRNKWWRALKTASERGWKIRHVIRLNENARRILTLVGDIIENISAGSDYTPYYFRQYGSLKPPYDILVVPGQGSMQLFATKQPDFVDTAFYTADPLLTQALSEYFGQLARPSCISPLMKMYPYSAGSLAFEEVITRVELQPADRFLVQAHLSALTLPIEWLDAESKWAQAHKAVNFDQAKIVRLVDLYKQRVKEFYKQVDHYLFRDICSKRAVENLRDYGEYARIGVFTEDLPDCIEHLNNVIKLLEYPNYELALVDESQEHFIPLAFWLVKANTVLLDAVTERKDNASGQVEITEKETVKGFYDYFMYLWTNIKEENRNKTEIIDWLQKQVAYLERKKSQRMT
jgi:hypothetical protein